MSDSDLNKDRPQQRGPDLDLLLDPSMSLTENQRRYLEEFVKNGGNKAKALRDAKLSPANQPAYNKMMQSPAAKLYMKQIKNRGLQEASLTVAEIVTKFRTVFDEALANGDFKAANEAAKLLGQYKGMFIDKSETKITNNTHISGDKPMDIEGDIKNFEDIVTKVAKGIKKNQTQIN